jgi:tetratricopeptide (TPR) repeat protein
VTDPPRAFLARPVHALKDVDAAERAELVRVAVLFGGPCFIILSALWIFLSMKQAIPGWLSMVLILVANPPLTIAGVLAVHHGTMRAAVGLVHTIFAAGNIPPPKSYPRQETMIIRGQFAEAAEYFRDYIRVQPDDLEARLRLADLLVTHLGGFDEAERLYREVREGAPAPRELMAAHNGLIDLNVKAGRRDRLKVELARFADRYRGSPHAEDARRRLMELKAEDEAGGRTS